MSILRRILTGLLVFVTVATSGPMATARVTPQGEVIVICTGEGLQEIMLDADGAPMTPLPHCPDCVMQLLATLTAPACTAGHPVTLSHLEPIAYITATATARPAQTHARGPPRLS
jgi:hypothetical protein